MAVSGGMGKPGSITPLNPGSSITTICGQPGSASATHCRTVRRCSRTARTATSKASAGGAPRRASARPMVTGPTTCHLIGPCRPTAAARNARRPPNASWSRSSTTAASGSRRSTSTRTSPSSSMAMPRTPTRPWARIRSAGERRGSDGTAGRSGRSSSTKSAAAPPSVWGRLPTAVATPAEPWTCIAPPPPCAHRTVVRGCPMVASRWCCRPICPDGPDRALGGPRGVAAAAGHGGRRGEPRRVGHEHGRPHRRRHRAVGAVGRRPGRRPRPDDGQPHGPAPPRARSRAGRGRRTRRAPGPRRRRWAW